MFDVRCAMFDVETLDVRAFLLFQRHEFHSAFRAIARMIGYDFGMHPAGVLLLFLLLVTVIVPPVLCLVLARL